MVVGSLIVSFSLSAFLFARKYVHSWQETKALRASVQTSLQIMARDLAQAGQITELSDTSLTLSRGLERRVYYHFGNGRILRNMVHIADTSVKLNVSLIGADSLGRAFKIKITGNARGREQFAEAVIARPQSSRTDVSHLLYGDK